MSDTEKTILQKVGIFFMVIPWKKILTFLFFLFLSLVFWTLQMFRQKYERTLSIPIHYTNVPENIVFDKDLPSKFEVRIKDDGASFIRYMIRNEKDTIVVDMKNLMKTTSVNAFLQTLIRSKLYSTSEVESFQPQTISFDYSLLAKEKKAVALREIIEPSLGYSIDGQITLAPDSVVAYGSKRALDTLQNMVATVADTLKDFQSDQFYVGLHKIPGIKFVPDQVRVNVPIDEISEKTIEVPVECDNLPKNVTAILFPEKVKVTVYVGLKRFDHIHSEDFKLKVDYKETKEGTEKMIPVHVGYSPNFIKIKSIIPSKVEYILEK